MQVGIHIIARGIVQGVGFRYFVFHLAAKFDLGGFVANLPNGDVEIEVEGDRSLIEEFIKEVKVGPRAAYVSDLQIRWLDPDKHYKRFEIY
jgi:acylphosphatase